MIPNMRLWDLAIGPMVRRAVSGVVSSIGGRYSSFFVHNRRTALCNHYSRLPSGRARVLQGGQGQSMRHGAMPAKRCSFNKVKQKFQLEAVPSGQKLARCANSTKSSGINCG